MYPLETLENYGSLMFSGGIEKNQWIEMDLQSNGLIVKAVDYHSGGANFKTTG